MKHWSLTFPTLIDYRAFDEITVKVDLANGAFAVIVNAKLDCGSKFCVFQPHFARLLGFELESGVPQRIRTAAGSFPAYGHEVTLTAGDLEWQTTVYFAEPEVSGPVSGLTPLQMSAWPSMSYGSMPGPTGDSRGAHHSRGGAMIQHNR